MRSLWKSACSFFGLPCGCKDSCWYVTLGPDIRCDGVYRINTLSQPTAFIAFCTFIPAYVQRDSLDDLAYWLLFMLIFIVDTVVCVSNAYNNITWVSGARNCQRTRP